MTDREGPTRPRGAPSWDPRWLAGLGILSVLVFWVPLAGPAIQAITFVQCLRAARWGVAEGWDLALGLGGAVVGFGLFLAKAHFGL